MIKDCLESEIKEKYDKLLSVGTKTERKDGNLKLIGNELIMISKEYKKHYDNIKNRMNKSNSNIEKGLNKMKSLIEMYNFEGHLYSGKLNEKEHSFN